MKRPFCGGLWLVFFTLTFLSTGCGGYQKSEMKKGGYDKDGYNEKKDGAANFAPMADNAAGKANEPQAQQPPQEKSKPVKVERKIQYTGNIQTEVTEYQKAEDQLLDLVKKTRDNEEIAVISSTNVDRSAGVARTGTYTIRVPVSQFEAFMAEALKIGSVLRNSISSQDRTVEYYDLKKRIDAKQELIQELKKFYQTAKTTDDTLKVYREINSEQTDLEGMKGRFLALENMTAMSTVTVQLIADKSYIPEEPRTFGENISDTFWVSVDTLLGFGRGLVLIVVAVAPWLPLVAIAALIVWFMIRRRKKPIKVQPVQERPPEV